MGELRTWYVDSSVVLRAIVDQSPAARAWFEERIEAGDRLVASRLMEVEVRRVAQNLGVSQDLVNEYVDEFWLLTVDDDLLAEAIALPERLGGADAIHVASALRLGSDVLILVTHDRQMATAAGHLGFVVVDPVTDDPPCYPVDRFPVFPPVPGHVVTDDLVARHREESTCPSSDTKTAG
ncbi:MAG: type II toxin-antitoxin system VapC family toxin [Propionibacteriaceae bacterium]|jgi:predicted nucleic acid-binding protein|nr:type II toxin-antitoxin system VapC family toxin [Propionibacteriaceae bacterium]